MLINCTEVKTFGSQWQKFLDRLMDADLVDVTSLKRLVDGTMLSKALGVKPGKWMTRAMDVCLAWQLRNPGKDNPIEAIDEVRQRSHELGISSSSNNQKLPSGSKTS
jgi:tRNA nucleotidyltransferase (CCA-adding enzyme)